MSCNNTRKGVWQKAMPINKPASNSYKSSNKFAGKKPFIPSYEKEKTPDMKTLISWGYFRQWKEELEKFIMANRNAERGFTKKTFPIYRKIVKKPESEEKPRIINKKYANVKSKFFDIYKK